MKNLADRMHVGYGALAIIAAIFSGAFIVAALMSDGIRAGAAAQGMAAVIGAIALLVAVWAVIVTKHVASEINSLSLAQRRLTANSEMNRLWQQLNIDVYKGAIVKADLDLVGDASRTPTPPLRAPKATDHDDIRLQWVHILLGILRQIWLYQRFEEVEQDFWETPARYWSKTIIADYPKEWSLIVESHRGYDLDFLEMIVIWSKREQASKERLAAIGEGKLSENAEQKGAKLNLAQKD